ncbi:MAG: YgcG family protein [Acidimicrobiia bacterium]
MTVGRRLAAGLGPVALLTAAAIGVVVALAGAAGAALPEFTGSVVDDAGAVPAPVEQALAADLDDFRARTGRQVAVAVVETTGDDSLEDYSIDLARAWGVGDQGDDDGVLLLLVIGDRQARIEVGRGVEGDLTDSESGRIIRGYIVPHMQAGDVGGALTTATEAIRVELGDDLAAPPAPVEDDDGGSGVPWGTLVPLGLVGLALSVAAFGTGGGGPRRRGMGRRGMGGAPIIWGGGFGGGGFGGGGGGGFGGGGGGGFGGGGASGGW